LGLTDDTIDEIEIDTLLIMVMIITEMSQSNRHHHSVDLNHF